MFEQLKYKNHLNEVYEFGKDGIYINTSDLHDYEWKVTSKGKRISSLDRNISTRKLPVIIMCASEADGIAARNRLHEITEKDVLANKHGQIIIGDYSFKCFVTKSQKKEYQTSQRYMQVNLTLTSDFPYWVKEVSKHFTPASITENDPEFESVESERNLLISPANTITKYGLTFSSDGNGSYSIVGTSTLSTNLAHTDFILDHPIAVKKSISLYIRNNSVSTTSAIALRSDSGEISYAKFLSKNRVVNVSATDQIITTLRLLVGANETIDITLKPMLGDIEYADIDYPFDYVKNIGSTELNNSNFVDTNFRLIIYGDCINPTITIAGHKYQVNCNIDSGEYLTIDSVAKTITLTGTDGTITNKFSSRDKDSYIFQKIPAGSSVVSWEGDFSFDLILLEERSEPKWT